MDDALRQLNDGQPVFSRRPFKRQEGAHLRTLFSFVCEAPDAEGRASSGEDKGLNIWVPAHVEHSFKRTLLGQGTNTTAVMARYMAAHVELSLSSGEDAGGVSKTENSYLQTYRSGTCPWWPFRRILTHTPAPLSGRPGQSLSELFRFACSPRRPSARTKLEQTRTGFRAPASLKRAFDSVRKEQAPSSTEILVRYMTLHAALSEQAF